MSQLLFAEAAEVLETSKDFTRIKSLYDGYEGWVQSSQLTAVDEAFANTTPLGYTYKRNTPIIFNGSQMFLSVGTPILSHKIFGQYDVAYAEEYVLEHKKFEFDSYIIKTVALLFENVPYLWGGKSSFGIDCSGLAQQVFKIFDKKLLRDAYLQATQGETIPTLEDVATGDLAFFDNEEGRITHVGILLKHDEIIHASGKVRIDTIDSEGITNRDTQARTHHLCLIKRY